MRSPVAPAPNQETLELLDELLAAPRQTTAEGAREETSLVGFCVDTRHPVLAGRILVRWSVAKTTGDDETAEQWLPCLRHVVAREGDRVMLVYPANAEEPVVVGVLDGFARRPETPRDDAAVVEVKADERLMVRASDGTPLVEVHQEEDGPVVRVLSDTTHVKLPGAFKLEADAIQLQASRGTVGIRASDDVDIDGEMIHLNSPKPGSRGTEP